MIEKFRIFFMIGEILFYHNRLERSRAEWCIMCPMKVVTASEMRAIDAKAMQEFGISSLVLMERAGLAVVSRIKELFGRRKIVVLAGSGNNGGDGLVVARDLYNEEWDVRVFLMCEPDELRGDALAQFTVASRFGVPMHPVAELLARHATVLSRHTVIVDAIVGTGLSKEIAGPMDDVITLINASGLPIVSIDMPSGISSDTGKVMGNAVKAYATVTLGLPKRGNFLYPGAAYTGRLYVEDIGLPRRLTESADIRVARVEDRDARALIPVREADSHKGHYGHVFIVAGSRGKTGAARMAAKACLRSGAGLVTIGVPESLVGAFQSVVTEEMVLPLPDRGDGILSARASDDIVRFIEEKADVVAIGPGSGIAGDTEKILQDILRGSRRPVLIDADALRLLSGLKEGLRCGEAPRVLTPHAGEMKQLLRGFGMETWHIDHDRIAVAASFAGETKSFLVLKGSPTVIASPDGTVYLNSTGNPGMASAGTGDVLTGIISGMVAQRKEALSACILGVYLHGLAGDLAAAEKGEHALIASDVIDHIPTAFRSLLSGRPA